jgi:glycerate 2-kinase
VLKIVVAPNAFKGSLSAPQAAAAMARGVRQVFPDAEIVEVPVADGGDGTVEALVSAHHGTLHPVVVEGPLGDPVTAAYGLVEGGSTGVVELATASGLALIAPERRDPRRASTYGFGQLLEAVRKAGVKSIIAGIGGSATNDGGAGMAQAIGYRLLDASGLDLPRGGAALVNLDRIVRPASEGLRDLDTIRVACDVENPLTGPKGASYVYGPQKGADAETVRELDRALARLAEVIERDLGLDVAVMPGSGAAGGTGAGLVAFANAVLVRGAPLVVEASGFDRALEGASLVITGEGRVDGQTAFGKAPGEVARRAHKKGVPTLLIAGSKGPGWQELMAKGVTAVVTVTQEGDPEGHNLSDLMRDAGPALTRVAASAVRDLLGTK